MNVFARPMLWTIALLLACYACADTSNEKFHASYLRCEYLENPLAVETENPRFSWVIQTETPGFIQSAYQIRVAVEDQHFSKSKIVWDSKAVNSSETNQIYYGGEPLSPKTEYFWQVRVWDLNGEVSAWSTAASFQTGLYNSNWVAKWIGDEPSKLSVDDYTIPPSPLMRKTFEITKPIQKAILYATAKGIYEAQINGQKVGSSFLTPGWTDYAKRIQYQANDVTDLMQNSKNCISVVLADGWYAGRLGPIDWNFPDYPWRGWYGRDLRFLGQLEIWYEDGSRELIASDESWKIFKDGPIQEADIFIGVTRDFQKALPGWRMPDYIDDDWGEVTAEVPDYGLLEAQYDQQIQQIRTVKPIGIQKLASDVYVVDMGQNMVGWLKLPLVGNPGDTIVLKHAEMLLDDGSVYRENLRNAPQIDQYIMNGDTVVAEPLFTFHGFRYVQIEGLAKQPDLAEIEGIVLLSATPETGSFICSNPMLNQLWHNIRWTQWGNQLSVPTDCPQRSERMGWMGDAQVFAQTAIYNHDMAAFYTKWGVDIMDAQFPKGEFSDVSPRGMPMIGRFINAPGWADAGLIVPMRLYDNYGDKNVVKAHYESMKLYVDRIEELNPELIYLNGTGHAYNDWLNGNTIINDDYPKTGGEIPRAVFNTAFFARSTRLLVKAAKVLGYEDDAQKYNELAGRIVQVFQDEFIDSEGLIEGDTQAGYAIALDFDLVPKELKMKVFQRLLDAIDKYDGRMSTGFISTICMMKQLSENGYHQLACQLAETTRFPSWGYSIEQGATTIWERWDAYVKGRGFQNAGMNSFNHYTFGSIGEWMYKYVLGIQPYEEFPGWRHFKIAPQMGGTLTYASGSYNSINGKIAVSWQLNHNELNIEIEVPPNTSADLILPNGYLTEVYVDGKRQEQITPERKISLKSGKHSARLIGK